MNPPEIQRHSGLHKHNAQHKRIHDEFLILIQEKSLQQPINLPTYVHDDAVDQICTISLRTSEGY